MKAFPHELVRDLTKPELRSLIEILHYSNEVKTQKDFGQILGLVRSRLSVPSIVGGAILSKDVDASNLEGWEASTTQHWLVNESYPVAWMTEYFERKYYQYDPVMEAIATSFGFTKTWAEMRVGCNPSQLVVFDRAATYGLVHGVAVSHFDQESTWSTFLSCAWSVEGEDVRLKPVVSYILQRVHQKLVIWSRLLRQDGRERFTSQEREVLRWLSGGKTTPEISRIVGLKERTIKYYVSRLFLKLNVYNRAQLVSEAKKIGLLDS
jgi:DNA-binding CsgD family transcriptional regulator